MKLLVAIAPERYRDEELDEPLAEFRANSVVFDIASTRTGTCSGMLGGKMAATLSFDNIDPSGYDGIMIIGGGGSKSHLWGDRNLAGLVTTFHSQKKIIAAICLSPVVLARAGVLRGMKATVFNSPDAIAEMKKEGAVLTGLPVVEDGMVITADGPGASRAFGKAVISALAGKK